MTIEEITKALNNLVPNTLWTLRGEDYSQLEWESEGTPPSIAEIEAEVKLIPAKEKAAKQKAEDDKAALLAKLGITAEEAVLLLS